ncbi:helix-turn-helix domain-containing protein [Paenibacillus sp. D2_2]|uniref:TetR/AcrR family transcriptional regulator n=1 Tax=Paenibacillus sp. D2_2 TaxID=3073092 RepID=UPI0028161706|nr:helix-turn-helix domain-containing protein [Paenibacillus sp. D2_2]WMT42940.1 helix-turn-helix domain-containing protein [Paenibacillus sp. D2_2]
MANSKRKLLLEAASAIIMEQGIRRLTLEEVAARAGVSKGGLLYHFASKDELIKGLNEETIREFRELLQQALEETGSYTKSYLLATVRQLEGLGHYNASSSMLAAIATNMDLIQLWEDDYQRFRSEMTKRGFRLRLA